ncbi:DUF2911 domain-containing protein [Algoriphagus limi]|uniref:DUF2911 domain-containing protein n=1 Tax=Algoriphagus limi TaxID=2975273 RepID=A0ABT2G915_9BACT|nr:DUF2911 domain-containing protein [Algoriphagus limi]MCS5491776.1 DUF2911 domain-containing protein [Algoriphagus limi]
MKHTKLFALTALLIFACSLSAFAQLQTPALSPAASVSQVVGFTKISIDFSSPAVRGRQIFGDIEKWDVTWRAGANLQTTIELSTDVSIAGKNVRAGKYSIFMTPTESGDWTVHINSKGVWIYNYMKDGKIDEEALAKDDLVSFKATTERGGNTERLVYTISANDNKTALVTMAWESIKVTFPIDTQVDQKMEQFKSQLN